MASRATACSEYYCTDHEISPGVACEKYALYGSNDTERVRAKTIY